MVITIVRPVTHIIVTIDEGSDHSVCWLRATRVACTSGAIVFCFWWPAPHTPAHTTDTCPATPPTHRSCFLWSAAAHAVSISTNEYAYADLL